MGRRLRVFISSTMEDLRDERKLVREKLELYNLEPVNAEDVPSRSGNTWATISREIESADIFVVLIGDRYGWIPSEGPFGTDGLAVTHLEFRHAKTLKLPILSFRKDPPGATQLSVEDAKKRKAFIDEVRDWSTGGFTNDFASPAELAHKVGLSVLSTLTDAFSDQQSRTRPWRQIDSPARLAPEGALALPAQVVKSVSSGTAILFAGSGISIAAGLPSAPALVDWMLEHLGVDARDPISHGASFAAVASVFVNRLGNEKAMKSLAGLLGPPIFKPTEAHRAAVKVFRKIVTTNYDAMFEMALDEVRDGRAIYTSELEVSLPETFLVKLQGSVSSPDSLLLSENDVYLLDKSKPQLWTALVEQFRDSCVIAIGSSITDPSVRRLFADAAGSGTRFVVAPTPNDFFKARVKTAGFETINADADNFFRSLAAYL